MKDYILFVDTETSGLPKNWNASYAEVDQWPHIVQVAWVIYEKNGREIKSENHIIKALDYNIHPHSQKIHGISESLTIEKGKDRKRVLKKIHQDIKNFKPLIVGHFMEFDSHMLSVGFRRVGLKNIMKNSTRFCTMTASSSYKRYPNSHYPKLDELYQSLFKRKMDNHHDALNDARATAACFFELLQKGDINDKKIKDQQKIFRTTQKNVQKPGWLLVVGIICILIILIVTIFAF